MTLIRPTRSLVEQHVRQMLEAHPRTRTIGLRVGGSWDGPDTLALGGTTCHVRWCPSALAFREALAEDLASDDLRVLLTERSDQDLGGDVLARLPKRRLSFLDPWAALQHRHAISTVAPRLRGRSFTWLAEELLRHTPDRGLRIEATGFLSEAEAWRGWLEFRFGIPGGARSLGDFVEWAEGPAASTWDEADDERRSEARRRLAERLGGAAAGILALLDADRAGDIVPLGLVLRGVFDATDDDADAALARREAAIRLEGLLGQAPLDAPAGLAWAAEAERVVTRELHSRDDADRAGERLARADRLLEELRAGSLAAASDVLLLGLSRRRARVAKTFRAALADPSPDALEAADDAVRRVLEHRRMQLDTHRRERRSLEMGVRLLRWLTVEEAPPAALSLPEAVLRWGRESSFVDWARTAVDLAPVDSGPEGPALAAVYRDLLDRALERREAENETWGRLVQGWFEVAHEDPRIVPTEDVLETVVGPLAAVTPVLFLVMDGMSVPVFHELVRDLQLDWQQIGEAGQRRWALSPLPSVTAIARTSLLTGQLSEGSQRSEQRAFATHPALVRPCRAGREPLLFHKGEVRDARGSEVPESVRTALADRERRVVGIVVNAVDDHLLKGDQVVPEWTVGNLQPFASLLSAAEQAGRVVVLTADHGHVLDRGTQSSPSGGGGERWRPGDAEPGLREVRVRGPRVRTSDGAIVVPWTETVRYGGARRNGYHGGATLQEMVVPLAVLAGWDRAPEGWEPLEGVLPRWWETPRPEAGDETAPAREKAPKKRRETRPKDERQIGLFGEVEGTSEPEERAESGGARSPEDPGPARPRWIAELLASEAYRSQMESVPGGVQLGGDRLPALLEVLDRFSGSLTHDALGRALNVPRLRLNSLLAASARLLNVDGYEVLRVDLAGDAVHLDRALLATQFDLGDAPGSGSGGRP